MSTFEQLSENDLEWIGGGEGSESPKSTWLTSEQEPSPKSTWLTTEPTPTPSPKSTW